MPKLFPIHIEVEELAVGKVMRVLNALPGVAKLHLDLERQQTKPNGAGRTRRPFRRFDGKAEDLVLALLFKEALPTSALKQHFADAGRSPLSVNSTMTEMKDHKLVAQRADGAWMLTKLARDRARFHAKKKKR